MYPPGGTQEAVPAYRLVYINENKSTQTGFLVESQQWIYSITVYYVAARAAGYNLHAKISGSD